LTALAANFGQLGSVPAYLGAPRLWRLEQGVEVQHQLMPRLGVTFGYVHWERYNTQASVNQFRTASDYTVMQFFNPISGEPLPYQYYNLTTAGTAIESANGAVLTDEEPKYKVKYNSFQFDFGRGHRGAQLFGGRHRAADRQHLVRNLDTVPDRSKLVTDATTTICSGTTPPAPGGVAGPEKIRTPHQGLQARVLDADLAGFTASAAYQNLDQAHRTFTYGHRELIPMFGEVRDTRGVAVAAVPCPPGRRPGDLARQPPAGGRQRVVNPTSPVRTVTNGSTSSISSSRRPSEPAGSPFRRPSKCSTCSTATPSSPAPA
jgi:hypothetical protein